MFNENIGRIIIDDNLVSIIRRAQVTQNYYDNKKARDKLKNASGEAERAQSIISDVALLYAICQEMINLEYVQTPNKKGVLSKKQTSREFLIDIISGLERKRQSLVENMNKELDGLPLMSKEYYSICAKESMTSADILTHYYKKGIPNYISIDKYEKEVSNIIHLNSAKMVTTKKGRNEELYRVEDGYYLDENNERKPKYNYLNIVEAGLYIYQQEAKKNILSIVKKITEPEEGYSNEYNNIHKQYDSLLKNHIKKYETKMQMAKTSFQNANFTNLQNIVIKITPLLEQMYSYEKSIVMFDRISEIINSNLNNGQRYQLVDKLKKEKNVFQEELKKLKKEIDELDKQFNDEMHKIETTAKKTAVSETKIDSKQNQTSKVEHRQRIEELKALQRYKKEILETAQHQEQSLTTEIKVEQQGQKKVTSQEQKKLYERYKIYRDTLDELFERKNQYSSEEYFQNDVVNAFYGRGLGTTYEEILKSIHDMRNQLEVTETIQKAIDDVRADYTSIEEMHQEDANGLTNFENRIIGRLITISTDNNISDELRSEINYYVKMHRRLDSEISFAVQNKNNYTQEEYNRIINDNKIRNYINTNILDEVGLTREVYKSK